MGRYLLPLILIGIGAFLVYENRQTITEMAIGGGQPAASADRRQAADNSALTRTITLRAGRGGHFFVTADVEGVDVDFVVDTGATMVVLTPEDAKRVGLRVGESDMTLKSRTAGGIVRAAPVTLGQVRIGQMTVRDVDALVNEKSMGISLLGVSFLRQLEGYEVRGDRLLLHW